MTDNAAIHENILRNIASGVIALDAGGRVIAFNASAARLLDMTAEEVLGRTISEVFVTAEGLDELTDAILDAVYHASVSEQRIVAARIRGQDRSLSVSTSYLEGGDGSRGGSMGVVAVFDDVSEVKELRENEVRLAREGHERHTELQDAYLNLEARNAALTAAIRKLAVLRWGATGLVVALFVGIGLYSWGTEFEAWSAPAAARHEAPAGDGTARTITVQPRMLRSHIAVRGRIEPLRSVAVNSPFAGTIRRVRFEYGEQVEKGQTLVEIDTSKIEVELRSARAAYINAAQAHETLLDEASNTTVAGARQTVHRARIELGVAREDRDELRFLLDRGVVPKDRYEASVRTYESQQMNLRSAQRNLEVVLKSNEHRKEITALELENARVRLRELETSLAQAAVTAPVAGVILSAAKAGAGSKEATSLAEGQGVAEGENLLSIGDLSGLSITSRADEIDISAIRKGLAARVSGDGFQGMVLEGRITHVSSQATAAGRTPSFALTAEVPALTAAQRKILRLGMSARLDVLVYENPDALMVPIAAVDASGETPRVRVRDAATGTVREVAVRTGHTTFETVEIVEGLEPGAQVVLAGG